MTVQNNSLPVSSGRPESLTFPPGRRIASGLDFQKIYALKEKAADGRLVIFAAVNGLSRTRIGLSVSKRQGNSVKRHRLRRLLREAYRLEQHQIVEGLDLILIPGHAASRASQAEFRISIVSLARRLATRLGIPVEHQPGSGVRQETRELKSNSSNPEGTE